MSGVALLQSIEKEWRSWLYYMCMDWDNEARNIPDEPVELPRQATPEDADKERCVICLMALRDRTIVGVCGHEFCVSEIS